MSTFRIEVNALQRRCTKDSGVAGEWPAGERETLPAIDAISWTNCAHHALATRWL
jgi:hypothetical protein